jgi:hypothetical protein
MTSGSDRIAAELAAELDVAETKAWDALSRYKFQMFGYWAAIWVHLNRIGNFRRPNPWAGLVASAKARKPASTLPPAPMPLLLERSVDAAA